MKQVSGSFINDVLSNMHDEPVIGKGATLLCWSDRRACTIIEWNGKIMTIQEDKVTRLDNNGASESQDYKYEKNPHGRLFYFRRDNKGEWNQVRYNPDTKRWVKLRLNRVSIGVRNHYYDYSF